jgi:membrane associated rhomboid family serine protease
MFIPLSAGRRTYTAFPIGTTIIVVVNVLVYLWQMYLLLVLGRTGWREAIWEWGFNPYLVISQTGHRGLTIFTSMFMHSGLEHIFFNLLYLWVFGPMVEDLTGSVRFLLFYILSGVAGAALNLLLDPNQFVPGIGASGAIAGVMGAFLLLHPVRRIRTLIFILIPVFPRLPAWALLIYWILQEVVLGEIILAAGYNFTGVGVWAHIGGFFGGLLFIYFFLRQEVLFNRESVLQFVRR